MSLRGEDEHAADPRKICKTGANFSTQTGTVSDFLAEEERH